MLAAVAAWVVGHIIIVTCIPNAAHRAERVAAQAAMIYVALLLQLAGHAAIAATAVLRRVTTATWTRIVTRRRRASAAGVLIVAELMNN